MQFTVRGIPQEVADEVRRTRLSPGYGHPAHRELARGSGPRRSQIEQLFAAPEARWLHVRHAEAGCFIARVERAG